ncbi:hypothetical protein KCU73_g2934, partial [Aureobasidium melanogenum]
MPTPVPEMRRDSVPQGQLALHRSGAIAGKQPITGGRATNLDSNKNPSSKQSSFTSFFSSTLRDRSPDRGSRVRNNMAPAPSRKPVVPSRTGSYNQQLQIEYPAKPPSSSGSVTNSVPSLQKDETSPSDRVNLKTAEQHIRDPRAGSAVQHIDYQTLLDECNSMRKEIAYLKGEYMALAREKQDLETMNTSRVIEVENLQCEKADLTKEIDDIKRAADKLQTNMRKKDVSFAPQLPDSEVLPKIYTLISKIKSWSRYFLGSDSSPSANFDSKNLHIYRTVFLGIVDLNSLRSMLEDRKRRRLFVRGLTAYIMCMTIFPASPTKHHRGSDAPDRSIDSASAKSFSTLENTMLSSGLPDGKVNDWRALTFHLFSMLKQTDGMNGLAQAEIQKTCDSITSLIKPWCQVELDYQKVCQELFEIFDEGVRLSQMLRQQRAYWTIRFPQVIRTNVSAPGAPKEKGDGTKSLHESGSKKNKTYSSRDSHVVTHRSTNLPFNCLCMAERTGCPVFS